jgi:hypothetical protein
MDHNQPQLIRDASLKVIYPIGGLMGGLTLGTLLVHGNIDEVASLRVVLQLAIRGFFLGLAVVLVSALITQGWHLTSIKRLGALIAIAALLCWFIGRVFAGLLTI